MNGDEWFAMKTVITSLLCCYRELLEMLCNLRHRMNHARVPQKSTDDSDVLVVLISFDDPTNSG